MRPVVRPLDAGARRRRARAAAAPHRPPRRSTASGPRVGPGCGCRRGAREAARATNPRGGADAGGSRCRRRLQEPREVVLRVLEAGRRGRPAAAVRRARPDAAASSPARPARGQHDPRPTPSTRRAGCPSRPASQGWPVSPGATRWVDLLRVAAQQHRDLVDDDVAHQVGEVLAVVRADLQRAPVDHDPRRHLAAVLAVRGQHPGQRHAAVVEDVGVQDDVVGAGVLDPRHVLDGELDPGQLPLPAALELLDRVEHEVVELLGAAAGQRHLGGHQATAQAATVSVAAGSAGRRGGRLMIDGEPTAAGEPPDRCRGPRGHRAGWGARPRFPRVPAAADPPRGFTVLCVRNRW